MQYRPSKLICLRNYSEALKRYEKTDPWRNASDPTIRPLESRRKHHVTIRKLNDGSIACRLYRTDVVTYHPDDSITIQPYNSNSTNSFANALLPAPLAVNFTSSAGWLICLGQRDDNGIDLYNCFDGDSIRIRPTETSIWQACEGPSAFKPFTKYLVNRQRAKALLGEYQWTAFTHFNQAYQAMRSEHGRDNKHYGYIAPHQIKDMFKDRAMWPRLSNEFGHILQRLRTQLYKTADPLAPVFVPVSITEPQTLYQIRYITDTANRC